jgi:hypothetical protein
MERDSKTGVCFGAIETKISCADHSKRRSAWVRWTVKRASRTRWSVSQTRPVSFHLLSFPATSCEVDPRDRTGGAVRVTSALEVGA